MTMDAGRPSLNRLPPIPRLSRSQAWSGAAGSNARVTNGTRSRVPRWKRRLGDFFWVGQRKTCKQLGLDPIDTAGLPLRSEDWKSERLVILDHDVEQRLQPQVQQTELR